MRIVFTYLPIRLKEVTEIYIKYSITNLNKLGIKPIIFSNEDYFRGSNLEYDYENFNVDNKFKLNNLWSYPKIKVLSKINFSFLHIDNDFLIDRLDYLNSKIKNDELNLCYKHDLEPAKKRIFTEIFKKYSNKNISFDFLNNTSIIGTSNYQKVNEAFKEVSSIIENDLDYFNNRIENIPPITLNQQFLNLYFNKINYVFDSNPEYKDILKYGVCHISDKEIPSNLITNRRLI